MLCVIVNIIVLVLLLFLSIQIESCLRFDLNFRHFIKTVQILLRCRNFRQSRPHFLTVMLPDNKFPLIYNSLKLTPNNILHIMRLIVHDKIIYHTVGFMGQL